MTRRSKRNAFFFILSNLKGDAYHIKFILLEWAIIVSSSICLVERQQYLPSLHFIEQDICFLILLVRLQKNTILKIQHPRICYTKR